MQRFHFPAPMAIGATVDLPETIAHHLHVLRMQAGDAVVLFNGESGEYRAILASIEKRRAQVRIEAFDAREAELPYAITLAQALPEGGKMDWIIEKCVELGAAAFQPLQAQRCVVKLGADRAPKKIAHWQAIAVAACEQSGRNRVPQVAQPLALASWLDQARPDVRLMLSPRATMSLPQWAAQHPPQSVSLLIGPEGGFSADEEAAALRHGVIAVSIGPRILRTETAGIATISALNAIWEKP
jgi:16S rRNA (uracil1498-N3)-methyltransferase